MENLQFVGMSVKNSPGRDLAGLSGPALDADRFNNSYAKDPSGCWLWTRSVDRDGYGRIGKHMLAHRLSWQLFRGEIPPRMCVCHTCDVPSCVNPEHLWLGTNAENTRDRDEKRRSAKGARQGCVKLTDLDVLEIRKSSEKQKVLADRFNVSQENISAIKRRKTWRHV